MPAKFHASVHRREEITYLKLSGVIDEDNDLGALADQVQRGTVVIDVGEIERINSCGVRDWVNWLGRVETAAQPGGGVVLVECSPSIVAQVNLVNNFTGNGVVKSFYAPYFCPQCDREKVLLIETRDAVAQKPFHAPTCRCDECDGPMDFDDMEESYFAFLQHTSKIVTDARVDDVITEFTPGDGSTKLRTRTSGVSLGNAATVSATPSGAPVSSLPSVPSLPSMKKLVETYSGATRPGGAPNGPGSAAAVTARYERSSVAPPTASMAAGAVAAPAPMITSRPVTAAGPRAPAPEAQSNKILLAVAGVLVVCALGLVAYLLSHT